MNVRVLTLFGEEIVPEELKATGAIRNARKKAAAQAAADDTLKHYYTIGEVAELLGIKTSHLRFWTNEFGLKVRTTRKGDRLYSADHIRELKAIYHLVKERGFTIAGAKAKLKEGNTVSSTDAVGLREALLQLRNQLVGIRNQLK